MFANVLIGVDGCQGGRDAVALALQLWVVSLQTVREEPIPADWPSAIDELIDRHAEYLAALQGVRGVITYGGPREELAQFGKNLDLLIVGSRGYGPIDRRFTAASPATSSGTRRARCWSYREGPPRSPHRPSPNERCMR